MSATATLRALLLAAALLAGLKAVSLVRDFPGLPAGLPPVSSPAMASAPTPPPAPAPAAPPPAPAPAAAPAPAPAPAAEPTEAVAAALRARREALEERERVTQLREAVLVATERRMAARIEELAALQQRLERAETAAREREDAHWRSLAKLYETMRPREAAAVFNELDLPVLAQVVDRMNDRKAAPILGAMQPDRVRQLTLELARMRAGRAPA
ncbi:MotE family protein [Falsiroseomonas sp. CW058]|uniref:MotE family protein n=1 Tax=Falsiroseomonas sp. CW058 TaxID=3388664 RepID=UPI003D311754